MKLKYCTALALIPFVLFLCETFFPTDFDPISDPKELDSDSQICQPKSD
ncbi:aldo-keto reductase family 1, member E1, isoform CRA_d [Rattus norvegicus]|uniref:Aldo-keto reductase family 1, member E1, isoform CRA_d n=1 Tax=Rattus norvegicus TaxID=10116 RepID=A6JLN7_RAT|nr:aldo-keto reductase family 1, member E1, isoform CRA_d [Rattus norvegicus]